MDEKFILLISSVLIHFTCAEREFIFVNEYLNWTAAQTYCKERGTDLVTVYDAQENQKLVTLAQNMNDCAWIGISYKLNTWRWSMGGLTVDPNSAIWASNQPNNDQGNQHCTVMFHNELVYDVSCTDNNFFICFDGNAAKQYILIQQSVAWWDAQSYCRTNHDDLASMDSDGVSLIILNLLKTVAASQAWIGLYRDPWSIWSDNNSTNFSNWETQPIFHETNDHCGCLSVSTGKWAEDYCRTIKPFFCYGAPAPGPDVGTQTILKVKLQSKIDLNNNVIQLQILEQMQNRLASIGAANITVKWRLTKKMTPDVEVPKEKCLDVY